jgi:hypothetical protein
LLVEKQYNYLKSCINNKGQIVDKKLKTPLNFQYHYSSFILSSVLLQYDSDIDKVIQYYLSIPKKTMKASNDFNVVLLSFALLNDKQGLLKNYKQQILDSFYHNSDDELYKLNNNFRALRLVGMILETKVKNIEFNQKIKDEIEWILDLQFDDGFFPDSNIEYIIEKNQGVPHLTYHTKIMMCVGLAYKYTKDERLKESFFKALRVLLEISLDNYYFFYGRSTNALFGYGSLYICFALAYQFSSDKFFLDKVQGLTKFLNDYQHTDGHISINLNKDDSKRAGFDGYMYDIVYNAYSNALFLLGNTMAKEGYKENYTFKLLPQKIKIHKNSGFVVYENDDIKYCFNYKGHQDSLKHRFDSRVSPFSLLYFQKDSQNMLPSVGYYPQSILSKVENNFYFRKYYSKIYKFFMYDYLPLLSGNSFFYIRDNIIYYPFKCLKILILSNVLVCKFKSKSRKLFSKSVQYDSFVISLKLDKQMKQKIIFYKEVDRLIYLFREFENSKFFMYDFDKEYIRLLPFGIETSFDIARLYRCEFNNIKKLNIKVKIND